MVSPHRGFTLPELITTIGISAILSGFLLPSFSNLLARHSVTTDANALLSIVLYARGEAIKRNGPVVVCRSDDGATCLSRNDGRWNDGLIVFSDSGNGESDLKGNGHVDSGEPIMRSESPLPGRSMIGGGPSSGSLRFDGNGRPHGLASTTFTIASATATRKLVISATGRPRVIGS